MTTGQVPVHGACTGCGRRTSGKQCPLCERSARGLRRHAVLSIGRPALRLLRSMTMADHTRALTHACGVLVSVTTRWSTRWARRGCLRNVGLRALAVLLAAALLATLLSACSQSGSGTGAGSEASVMAPGGLAAETSATGSFTNSVPIQVPKFHGIEPQVSLDYDSAAGNS